MIKNFIFTLLCLGVFAVFSACNSTTSEESAFADTAKIVSINGTVSEILVDLGFEENIIGVDVSSNYPASLQQKPKIGHSRQIVAEGILALNPDVVIGVSNDVKPELAEQIRSAGAKLFLFDHAYSPEGTKSLIKNVADSLGRPAKADSIIKALEADLAAVEALQNTANKPKVLFIYARGTGTMMVSGTGTQMEKMIELAGGVNAITEFEDFKPLTAEALVAANPDVILLFDSGLSSLGGVDGLLQVQGIDQTNAGRNRKIVEMDGQLLTGFSQRLGIALKELAGKIQ